MLEFNGHKILVDCGLLQGLREKEQTNSNSFKYNPVQVEFLLVTHAHMDHIGKIPKLVRDGFRGKIISTRETLEMAGPMLGDALKVMQSKNPDKSASELMYGKQDIEKALLLWTGQDYQHKINLFENCSMEMQNAGHILGSAIMKVTCADTTFAFTGDLGNSPSPLLPDTEFVDDADYIVMESVYGDRNHEGREERRKKLKQIILDGIERKGAIIIPAFSIERTQVLLYELNNMVEDGDIPSIPVFVDSPLASKMTAIYAKHSDKFKKEVQEEIKSGDDIFNFPRLSITHSHFESVELERTVDPKIILAGSGMSAGGRVVNHELTYLPDPKATIVLPGYQGIGTLGRLLEEGVKEVDIHGERVEVKAKIEKISGYSSHADSDHLLGFVEKAAEGEKLKKVFVIMGEPKSSLFLVQKIRDNLGVEAVYPEENKTYEV